MANLLDRFNKTVVGSASKLADYKSTITSSGDFKRIENIEVIINSWNNILITPKRTYMFDPEYGSNLYKLVFDPLDEDTKNRIVDEVVGSIRRYDDRAIITGVNITFLSNKKGFNISIDVKYEGVTTELQVIINQDTYFKFFETTQSKE